MITQQLQLLVDNEYSSTPRRKSETQQQELRTPTAQEVNASLNINKVFMYASGFYRQTRN